MSALLEVRGLGLRFGNVTALDGIDLAVHERELLAVIGPNGAGKSSLYNCISGLYRPQEGSITLAGPTCWRWRHTRSPRRAWAACSRTWRCSTT